VFVADTLSHSVYEMLAVNGSIPASPTVTTLSSAFVSPYALALDGSANVFVTDSVTGAVYEILAVGGYRSVTALKQTFASPTGVAVDRSENLFIADLGAAQVYELPVAWGYNNSIAIGNGFGQPTGVAVDQSGDVFVADQSSSRIDELQSVDGYTAVHTLGSGFVHPSGVAVNRQGDIFITDPGASAVFEIPASGSQAVNQVGTGYVSPSAVSVDSSGDIFVADPTNPSVMEIQLAGVNFGTVPVQTNGRVSTLLFTFDTGGTIGAPAVLYKGAFGQDYIDAASGSCTTNGTTNNYNPGDQCTVDVLFGPMYAGPRYGAVQLQNSSGAPIANASIYGTGSGPQITFSPGWSNWVGTGFSSPMGVAVDGNLDVFVADTGNNAVKRMSLKDSYTVVTTIGSGFNQPEGVAVDGGGNIFVADTGNNAVKEILAQNGAIAASPTIIAIGKGFSAPTAVTVDQTGNVLVVDTGNNAVKEVLAAGGYTVIETLGSGFTFSSEVAPDGTGNIFIADASDNVILQEDLTDPPYLTFASTVVGVASPDSPQKFTMTNSGNAPLIFPIASVGTNPSISSDFTLSASSTCPLLTSSSPSAVQLAAGASCTYAVSFIPGSNGSSSGSLVITDNNWNSPLPPGVAQSVSLSGIAMGSQTITFTQPTSPVALGVGPIALNATANSGLPVTFSLISGPGAITGNQLTITGLGTVVIAANQDGDANYTAAPTVEAIVTVTQATPAINNVSSANPVFLQNVVTLTTVVYSPIGTPTGTVTFMDGATPLGTATLVGGAATFSTSGLSAGSHTITVGYGGDATFKASTSAALTQLVVDFAVSIGSGASSETVSAGQTATYTFSVSPSSGTLPDQVTLSVSGLPAGATASITPSVVAAGLPSTNVVLSIQTSAASAANGHQEKQFGMSLPTAFLAIVLLPIAGRLRRAGKKLTTVAALLVFAFGFAVASGLSGCGANTPTSATTSQSYTVTMTAASGSLLHTANVMLTVK